MDRRTTVGNGKLVLPRVLVAAINKLALGDSRYEGEAGLMAVGLGNKRPRCDLGEVGVSIKNHRLTRFCTQLIPGKLLAHRRGRHYSIGLFHQRDFL